MSERWRSKPHYIDVVRYDHDGPFPIESTVEPPVPAPLREFAGSAMRMVQVGSRTHGGPDQWIPILLTASDHGETMKPGDFLTRDGRGLFHVLTPLAMAGYEPDEEAP